jgi:hypothetical protein
VIAPLPLGHCPVSGGGTAEHIGRQRALHRRSQQARVYARHGNVAHGRWHLLARTWRQLHRARLLVGIGVWAVASQVRTRVDFARKSCWQRQAPLGTAGCRHVAMHEAIVPDLRLALLA